MINSDYVRDVKNSNLVVLFIHGIVGSPNHFNDYINLLPNNVAIHNICLDGHGGNVSDFSKTSMRKWKRQVDEKLLSLIFKYKNVIIVAHSMGSFFAINSSLKYNKSIKALFLLAPPIKIRLKPTAITNSLKVIFNKIDKNDKLSVSARESYGIERSIKLWEYIFWLPRYLELFEESRSVRTIIDKISVKTYVFLSLNDEMVSINSYKYLTSNPFINLKVLKNSRHFYYDTSDKNHLLNKFSQIIFKFNN